MVAQVNFKGDVVVVELPQRPPLEIGACPRCHTRGEVRTLCKNPRCAEADAPPMDRTPMEAAVRQYTRATSARIEQALVTVIEGRGLTTAGLWFDRNARAAAEWLQKQAE